MGGLVNKASAGSLVAVIMEPILNSGGMNRHSKGLYASHEGALPKTRYAPDR
jgi:hypothetical protein